ncbi:hypothetical protein [Flagellimonas beolgyonensis]|uniref:hypothetical protein n=1 Tax=Flagellimonas beolgyonensis TaxID=864064 RepID=UPI000F8E1FB6|nr:hypothetical protein [Allomuricauda beolgyonensis]
MSKNTCALCKENPADKANTHYLTDGIIRSCLNQDGSGEREKGFYFDVSNNSAFVEFNFQRGTSIDKLEESLGRQASEEEIDKAKQIPFSVDHVFCTQCEAKFTEIETAFIDNLLPQFRNENLNERATIEIDDNKLFRLFFYLQIWRTHICEESIDLPQEVAENLRLFILNSDNYDVQDISIYPLSVTYLETTGGQAEYTSNFVGFTNDKNPFLIFFNDFIIQFYESQESVQFIAIHGLNSEEAYQDSINCNEQSFVVPIRHNAARKELLNAFITAEKVKQTVDFYANGFRRLWFSLFGLFPPNMIVQEYINTLTNGDFDILKYSKENIVELTTRFIERKLK